jgi:hypothetical protein
MKDSCRVGTERSQGQGFISQEVSQRRAKQANKHPASHTTNFKSVLIPFCITLLLKTHIS